jgi:hypothetical protein
MHQQLAGTCQIETACRISRISDSRFSENKQLHLKEAIDCVTDSTQQFQVNKLHPDCLYKIMCCNCGLQAYSFGLSNTITADMPLTGLLSRRQTQQLNHESQRLLHPVSLMDGQANLVPPSPTLCRKTSRVWYLHP